MNESLFENERCTEKANEISSEFRNLFSPLLEKYKEYSTIELEHLLVSELSVSLAEMRLVKQIKANKTNKYKLFEGFRKAYLRENLRLGQATFNSVYEVDPEIANELRGTDKDCFYDNSKISIFMEAVRNKWSKE